MAKIKHKHLFFLALFVLIPLGIIIFLKYVSPHQQPTTESDSSNSSQEKINAKIYGDQNTEYWEIIKSGPYVKIPTGIKL
jgi:hypothetical protein